MKRLLFAHRQGGMVLFLLIFMAVSLVTRIALTIKAHNGVTYDGSLAAAFLEGVVFDLAMGLFFGFPLAFLLMIVPRKVFISRAFRWTTHGMFCFAIAMCLFTAVAEWFFWDEFSVRFNFIAVDYLVYTTEVVENIRESYPMPLILGGLALATAAVWYAVNRTGCFKAWIDSDEAKAGKGRIAGFAAAAAPLAVALVVVAVRGAKDTKTSPFGSPAETLSAGLRHMGEVPLSFANSYNTELGYNGTYSFVAAFWSNELVYKTFYPTRNPGETFRHLREMLAQDNTTYVSPGPEANDITRVVRGKGPERRLNVMQITMESMSAEYLGCYGNPGYAPKNLTPNLDRLSREGIWFRRLYANGTRTVRGMEALTLAVPPTPGQAILRRPGCENMATMGSVFANRGYDCAFIYGGDGMFDNMNYFFEHNGYRIVDQPRRLAAHPAEKSDFANAWGSCDEVAFKWAIDEADRCHAAGKPFHQFVMTTSNHRPYTWPAGRVREGLAGREGGVAYTDYAIGWLLKAAESKPWFKDTVFVIVSDHCASVAGKSELQVDKYEIPMFIYSPGNIAPQVVDTLCSQVDLAPTLFGLLDFTYVSRFFGRDLLRPVNGSERAFVSNYQKLGLLENGQLTVLKPVAQASQYIYRGGGADLVPTKTGPETEDAIAWYQCASWLFNHGGMAAIPADKEKEWLDHKGQPAP